jgi:hypothetical protein
MRMPGSATGREISYDRDGNRISERTITFHH